MFRGLVTLETTAGQHPSRTFNVSKLGTQYKQRTTGHTLMHEVTRDKTDIDQLTIIYADLFASTQRKQTADVARVHLHKLEN